LAVCKQTAQNFHVERFNFKKLNELEVRKPYQMKKAKRFSVLENLNNNKDINSPWKNIKGNIKTSAKD
jgi:hypothetical protein